MPSEHIMKGTSFLKVDRAKSKLHTTVPLATIVHSSNLPDDCDTATTLIDAAKEGDYETLKELLNNQNASVIIDSKQPTTNNTALIWAAKKGHKKVVDLLLSYNADMTLRNASSETALEVATPAVKTLFLGVTDTPKDIHKRLFAASWLGDGRAVKRLLNDAGSKLNINAANAEGFTPLMLAARGLTLVDRGLKITKAGYNPKEVVDMIVKQGGAVNMYDSMCRTALYQVCCSNHPAANSIARILFDHDADVGITDSNGRQAIHCACECGNKTISQLLLDRHESVSNVPADNLGWTPLHYAAYNGHDDIVELLLDYDAEVNCKNGEGHSPIDLAVTKRTKDLLSVSSPDDPSKTLYDETDGKKLPRRKSLRDGQDGSSGPTIESQEKLLQTLQVTENRKSTQDQTSRPPKPSPRDVRPLGTYRNYTPWGEDVSPSQSTGMPEFHKVRQNAAQRVLNSVSSSDGANQLRGPGGSPSKPLNKTFPLYSSGSDKDGSVPVVTPYLTDENRRSSVTSSSNKLMPAMPQRESRRRTPASFGNRTHSSQRSWSDSSESRGKCLSNAGRHTGFDDDEPNAADILDPEGRVHLHNLLSVKRINTPLLDPGKPDPRRGVKPETRPYKTDTGAQVLVLHSGEEWRPGDSAPQQSNIDIVYRDDDHLPQISERSTTCNSARSSLSMASDKSPPLPPLFSSSNKPDPLDDLEVQTVRSLSLMSVDLRRSLDDDDLDSPTGKKSSRKGSQGSSSEDQFETPQERPLSELRNSTNSIAIPVRTHDLSSLSSSCTPMKSGSVDSFMDMRSGVDKTVVSIGVSGQLSRSQPTLVCVNEPRCQLDDEVTIAPRPNASDPPRRRVVNVKEARASPMPTAFIGTIPATGQKRTDIENKRMIDKMKTNKIGARNAATRSSFGKPMKANHGGASSRDQPMVVAANFSKRSLAGLKLGRTTPVTGVGSTAAKPQTPGGRTVTTSVKSPSDNNDVMVSSMNRASKSKSKSPNEDRMSIEALNLSGRVLNQGPDHALTGPFEKMSNIPNNSETPMIADAVECDSFLSKDYEKFRNEFRGREVTIATTTACAKTSAILAKPFAKRSQTVIASKSISKSDENLRTNKSRPNTSGNSKTSKGSGGGPNTPPSKSQKTLRKTQSLKTTNIDIYPKDKVTKQKMMKDADKLRDSLNSGSKAVVTGTNWQVIANCTENIQPITTQDDGHMTDDVAAGQSDNDLALNLDLQEESLDNNMAANIPLYQRTLSDISEKSLENTRSSRGDVSLDSGRSGAARSRHISDAELESISESPRLGVTPEVTPRYDSGSEASTMRGDESDNESIHSNSTLWGRAGAPSPRPLRSKSPAVVQFNPEITVNDIDEEDDVLSTSGAMNLTGNIIREVSTFKGKEESSFSQGHHHGDDDHSTEYDSFVEEQHLSLDSEHSYQSTVRSLTSASSSNQILEEYEPRNETERIIQWKKGQKLGHGAYGTVWQGFTSTGQLIAVKQISVNMDDLAKAKTETCKLQQEVDLLKTLRHRNIVRYLGTNIESGSLNIFMQFIPGGTIACILKTYGRLDESVTRNYTKQILQAVEYLHANNVIHRDIKGSNIMLMTGGTIKLIDFGCAKRICLELSISTREKVSKSMQGTPYWMAPEVIKEIGHGTKSDVWSIGCTVFEMGTGKPPWAHMPPYAALFHIGKDEPVPQLPDAFSKDIRTFTNWCLTRDQKFRPSASELLQHMFVSGRRRDSSNNGNHSRSGSFGGTNTFKES